LGWIRRARIALGCVPEPDEILRDLLIGAIAECAASATPDARCGTGSGAATWAAACALTGTAVVR
jgi:hypothetical protein